MNKSRIRLSQLMKTCDVVFGTSGARGLASSMTDKVCYTYATAFVQYLESRGELTAESSVVIGGDLRTSTARIMVAVGQAIHDRGYRIVNAGFLPTPALASFASANGFPGIMVTGSHIPEDRNGLKFYTVSGELLKRDEAPIKKCQVLVDNDLFTPAGALARPQPLPLPAQGPIRAYVSRYLDYFGKGALAGMRVGLYEHSSVARGVLAEILSALGAEVVSLGRSLRFVSLDTEAIDQKTSNAAAAWARIYDLDGMVSTDGDGDRPLMSDERGCWVQGDVLGLITAVELKMDAVATPVSSSTSLERSGLIRAITRTRIGSPYVIEAMQELAIRGECRVAGYEANGGFLLGTDLGDRRAGLSALPTRDAVLPMLCLLTTSRRASQPISQVVDRYRTRETVSNRLQAFPTAHSRQLLACFDTGCAENDRKTAETHFGRISGTVSRIDRTDGTRFIFDNGEIIHIRASGNAPELRCYTEADTRTRAIKVNDACLKLIEGWKDRAAA